MSDMSDKNKVLALSSGKLFAERLKIAMQKSGKKQVDIVNETGIDKGAISNYLHGKYLPKTDAMKKIAVALNISADWLGGYDDATPDSIEVNEHLSTEEQLHKVKQDICNIILRLHSDQSYFDAVKWLNELDAEELDAFQKFRKVLEEKARD